MRSKLVLRVERTLEWKSRSELWSGREGGGKWGGWPRPSILRRGRLSEEIKTKMRYTHRAQVVDVLDGRSHRDQNKLRCRLCAFLHWGAISSKLYQRRAVLDVVSDTFRGDRTKTSVLG